MRNFLLFCLAALLPALAPAQRIAVLSDIHVTPGNANAERLAAAVAEINASAFDLVVVDGDLTNEGSDAELAYVKGILDGIEHPLLVIPGNHENNWSQSAGQTFVGLWGSDRFATVLDSLVIVGINCGPFMKMGDGHVKQEDLHWLRATLDSLCAPGRRVLSFNHYPIRQGDLDNYRAYQRLLEQYPVQLHVNGHYHRWIRYDAGSIPCQMVRALRMGDGDYGYAILEVSPRRTRVYDKRIGEEPQLKETFDYLPLLPSMIDVKADTVWADSASVFTRLAFDADHVYFGTSTGLAKAVGKSDGALAWSHNTGAPLYSRAAVLAPGRVAVPTADGIDIIDGGSLVASYPSAEGPYVADGLVDGPDYFQGGYKRFEKRDARTGELAWQYDSIGNYCQAAPVVDGGDVIFGAWDTWLRCLDRRTGELRWQWSNGKPANMLGPGNVVPVVTDDLVVIVAPDRYMTALDRRTGRELWRDNSHRYRESLGRSADGKAVYAKTMDGELVAVAAEGGAFRELWTVDLGLGYEHAPCVIAEAGGMVWAGSRRGIVTAVDPAARRVVWQGALGESEINGIDVDPADGSVWVSLIEGSIIRLRPSI